MMMRSGWKATRLAGALACGLATVPALAQEELRFDLFRPQLQITSEGLPQSELEDIDGTLLRRRIELRASLPLGPTRVRPEGALLGYQMFAQFNLSSSPLELTVADTEVDRRLYSGAVRVSGLMASRAGNLYLASFGTSLAEDEETIGDPDVTFSGLGLGTYTTSNGAMLIYGGAVNFGIHGGSSSLGYGRRLAVPVFGLLWKYRPQWTLFTVLPFTARTTYRRSERTLVHFLLEAAGDRNRFANEGLFSGQPETVYYRHGGLKLGAEWEYRPNRDHALLVQGGILAGRELEFSTDRSGDAFLSTGIGAAGYLRLAWRVSFGESFLDQLHRRSSGDD